MTQELCGQLPLFTNGIFIYLYKRRVGERNIFFRKYIKNLQIGEVRLLNVIFIAKTGGLCANEPYQRWNLLCSWSFWGQNFMAETEQVIGFKAAAGGGCIIQLAKRNTAGFAKNKFLILFLFTKHYNNLFNSR